MKSKIHLSWLISGEGFDHGILISGMVMEFGKLIKSWEKIKNRLVSWLLFKIFKKKIKKNIYIITSNHNDVVILKPN
jgi:hypothetical protein